EVPDCDPAEFTIDTMPERFARLGDVAAGIDESAGSLDGLLEQAERDEASGLPDAPWPPHYEKQEGEEARVQPSKPRTPGGTAGRGAAGAAARGDGGQAGGEPPAPSPTGRRKSTKPLI